MMKFILLSLLSLVSFMSPAVASTDKQSLSREEIVQLINEGVAHWSKQQYDSAAFYLKSAEVRSEQIKDTQLLVACYNNRGLLFLSKGKYDEGIAFYRKSLLLFPDSRRREKLQAMLNIGITYKRKGDFEKAFEWLTKTQEYATHFPKGKELASCYNEMGIVKKKQKLYEAAIEYFNKSLVIRREIGYQKGIVGSLNNIGNAYKELKQYDKALQYYNEFLELEKQLGNKKYLATAYINIGDLQLRLKDYLNAKKNLLLSLNLKEKVEDRVGIVSSTCLLGKLYIQQKQYSKAENYLLRGKLIAEEIEALDLQREVYLQLKNLYVAKGNMRRAIAFYDRYVSVKDSIFNTESMQHMQDMETYYQIHEKEQQIKVLNLENQNKGLQLEQSKQHTIYLGAGLLLLVFALLPIGFFVKQHQKNRLLQERIVGENRECNRISRELHDGVASSLSHLYRSMERGNGEQSFVKQLRKISDEVRGISHQLNMNAIGNQSFRIALFDSLSLNHFPKEIDLQINLTEDFEIEDYNVKINLIRIVQELVNNSLKHAQASTIIIKFRQEKKHLHLEYADDGIGMDMEKLQKGNGMINIEERTAYFAGKMNIVTSPNNGFYAKVIV